MHCDTTSFSLEGAYERQSRRLKLKFVSRLPYLFSEGETLKDLAWRTNAWQDVGALREGKEAACYRLQWFLRPLRPLCGRTYHLRIPNRPRNYKPTGEGLLILLKPIHVIFDASGRLGPRPHDQRTSA
ncbi:MAG: hypothetical protein OWU32_11875 [Firmicutes bacterium]|nr:hypothetical protein [Bacillota bacterium]